MHLQESDFMSDNWGALRYPVTVLFVVLLVFFLLNIKNKIAAITSENQK